MLSLYPGVILDAYAGGQIHLGKIKMNLSEEVSEKRARL